MIMKKILLILAISCCGLVAAQAQQLSSFPGMNYQAVARDATGKLLSNKPILLRVNLLSEGPGGAVVYSEIHRISTSENGLFNLMIGRGEAEKGAFKTVPWAEKNIWMEIALSEGKKDNFAVLGASQLLAVPYAYHAGSAETIHFHEAQEKSACSRVAAGLPFWTVNGNATVDDECHFIGTTVDEDLVFKTNNIERLRIQSDGNIEMPGNLYIKGNLQVDGDGSFNNLNVKNNLMVGNQTSTKTLNVSDNATVGNQTTTKTLNVSDNAAVGKNATVGQDLSVTNQTTTKTLSVTDNAGVGKNATVGQDLNVTNQTTTKTLVVTDKATFNGPLETNGRLVVNGGADGSQSKQASYPVLVKGSTQGIAIEVNPATQSSLESGRGNNYVSFWKNGEMTGRIEGMSNADLDPTGLLSIVSHIVRNPPKEFVYNFGRSIINLIPTVDVDVDASLDPFGVDVDVDVSLGGLDVNNPFNSLNQTFLNFINNPSKGAAKMIFDSTFLPLARSATNGLFSKSIGAEALTNFESQITSNYTQDIVTNGIAVFGSVVETATSLASVLDPEDIVANVIDLVVDISSFGITAGMAAASVGVAFESGAGDYAEWLQRVDPNEAMSFGDVVGLNGGKVSKKFSQAERFMVVSAAPIVLGNMPNSKEGEKNMEKIAFMGQVPVKVRGVVHIGDYLLPSGEGDGLAIAVAPANMKARDFKRIIGVAWEESDGKEYVKLINTAVGLNQNDTGTLIEQMQAVINGMQKALAEVNPNYQPQPFEIGENTAKTQLSGLDYTVANTHPSQMSGYFADKTYSNRQEMLQDVKKVLEQRANIKLDNYPLVAYLFEHADDPSDVVGYYTRAQEAMRLFVAKK
jgi:carbonic anhydrase/acetyltransferase-like protein (isoleucine patch superfamily)